MMEQGRMCTDTRWLSFLCFMLFLLPCQVYAVQSVKIHVVDRGQADGMLIETPNGQWIVIDAGTNKQQAFLMEAKKKIKSLALAVVSHRHQDHQGGMDDILKAIPTKRFIGITEDCKHRTGDDRVRAALKKYDTEVVPLSNEPTVINIDGVRLTVLPLPSRSECPNEENLNSVVVRLDYGEFSMLFTGDAELGELRFLVNNYPTLLDVDVLKASHHGSKNGFSEPFLKAVTPKQVVISAGVKKSYRHPHRVAVEAYRKHSDNRVYCTNRHGSIRIFGYESGSSRFYKQRKNNKSCVYDGTHY